MILPHRTLPEFWIGFDALPGDAQALAQKAYAEWIDNPRSTGLPFKRLRGNNYSARIGANYRALCRLIDNEWRWF